MKFNKYWFKPKGFGYGATPTTWEGWMVVVVFIAYLISLSVLLTKEENMSKYIFLVFAGIVIVAVVSKKKTEGEWKWNFGKKKEPEMKNIGKSKE